MRKAKAASAIIIREKNYYMFQNFEFINAHGDRFECIHYNAENQHLAYKYKSIRDMIQTVLNILTDRGYTMDYYEEFNAKWYPIYFYNLSDTDAHFEHYAFK